MLFRNKEFFEEFSISPIYHFIFIETPIPLVLASLSLILSLLIIGAAADGETKEMELLQRTAI